MKKLNSGFSLIELLVTTSVGLIVMVGMISLLTQQQKEIRRLEIKSEMVDFRNELKMYLKSSAACKFNFENKTFNLPVTDSTSLTANHNGIVYLGESTAAPKLQAGQAHPSIRGLTINSIAMKNFRQPAAASEPSKWLADLVVDMKSSVMQFKPITTPIMLATSGAGPVTINDCSAISDQLLDDLEGTEDGGLYAFTPSTTKKCLMYESGYTYPKWAVELRVDASGSVEHRYYCPDGSGNPSTHSSARTCTFNWRPGTTSSDVYLGGGGAEGGATCTNVRTVQVDAKGAALRETICEGNFEIYYPNPGFRCAWL